MKKLLCLLFGCFFIASCQMQNQANYYTSLDCTQKNICLNFATRHCQKIEKERTNTRYSYSEERKRSSGFIGSQYRRIYKAYYQCA